MQIVDQVMAEKDDAVKLQSNIMVSSVDNNVSIENETDDGWGQGGVCVYWEGHIENSAGFKHWESVVDLY